MKFTRNAGAEAPADRSLQLRRDRAAAPVLRTLFPALAQLQLELLFEAPTGVIPVPQKHLLHPPARAYFVFPCPYADCDGQFDMTAAVTAALQTPALRTEGQLQCEGLRAGGAAAKRPCRLHLHYTVIGTPASAP